MIKNKERINWLKAYSQAHESLAVAFPSLTNFLTHADGPFRGLTAFLGDNNNVVMGIKRFADDGTPEIIWTSGQDPLVALMELDNALRVGKWKVDKRVDKHKM